MNTIDAIMHLIDENNFYALDKLLKKKKYFKNSYRLKLLLNLLDNLELYDDTYTYIASKHIVKNVVLDLNKMINHINIDISLKLYNTHKITFFFLLSYLKKTAVILETKKKILKISVALKKNFLSNNDLKKTIENMLFILRPMKIKNMIDKLNIDNVDNVIEIKNRLLYVVHLTGLTFLRNNKIPVLLINEFMDLTYKKKLNYYNNVINKTIKLLDSAILKITNYDKLIEELDNLIHSYTHIIIYIYTNIIFIIFFILKNDIAKTIFYPQYVV